MEEDSGVKAPLTRLRRRLSVEQSEDVKSPAPATPTKKRGGRLAAKPQLELIDEHGGDGTPAKRSTRKTSVKDAIEGADEKTVTPSRRSARIKSNTSIVSETTQSFDSPRAKRAARRTSQVGSDGESSVTPIRQTRKTRKDSTSSLDKLEVTLSGIPHVIEVVIEEDNMSIKSEDTIKSSENVPIRKSPRLKEKQGNNDGKIMDKSNHGAEVNKDSADENVTIPKQNLREKTLDQTSNDVRVTDDKLNVSKQDKRIESKSLVQTSNEGNVSKEPGSPKEKLNVSKQKPEAEKSNENDISNNISSDINSKENWLKGQHSLEKPNLNNKTSRKSVEGSDIDKELNSNSNEATSNVTPIKDNQKIRDHSNDENEHSKEVISNSSLCMIKELDKKPKNKSSVVNKSASALETTSNFQTKRQRTKSWTMTSLPQEADGAFFSDNEISKKKINKRISKELRRQSDHTGSGDNDTSKLNSPIHNSIKSRKSKELLSPNKLDQENVVVSSTEEKPNETSNFFEKSPTALLQSTVYFEDSDTDSKGKEISVLQLNSEDQCVPVIAKQLVEENVFTKKNENQSNNDKDNSFEPMDIDETMPNTVSITDYSKENLNNSSDNKEHEQHPSSVLMDNSLNKSSNKSKRKSSLSNTQDLEKSKTENKSTLILSQIKDVSSNECNLTKSPKTSNNVLSKSVGSVGIVKEKQKDRRNLSQDYSTSTPLQQKRKLGMQINSSIINSSNIENKDAKSCNASKNETTKISNNSESSSEEDSDSEYEENSSKEKSQFMDDEADEASDDYESGDSRDKEERQYEDENEIVVKGETLDSDDDVSNDTDYEKDSFVVSSNEEDNELLSGTDDDLSMSDNELSMSKKSKKKFNERKQKEQKKASKEMYEARHKLNESKVTSKKTSKKQKINSSSEDSDDEIVAPVKKNKHLRLNSTHEDDETDKSTANVTLNKKKSKGKKSLSESICSAKEQEISAICDKSVIQTNDPLSIQIKLEPKTPMKDLNISTIQINENIEEVQVDNNVSVLKTKEDERRDPLQATMLDEEDSSISENSEIINNYDSVLNELNCVTENKKVISLDMSLNLSKKSKNLKEPIYDQLNLTQTKKQKKAIGSDVVDSAKSKSQKKEFNTTDKNSDSSSDWIDLQLLFSEDSNPGDVVEKKNASGMSNTEVDDFIPLKRTPGKINILKNKDNEISEAQSIQVESTKKKNKKRKSQPTEELDEDDQTNNDYIQIVIDRRGTHGSESCNISLSSSTKKKKNNSAQENDHSALGVTAGTDAPEEILNESSKKKKKNRKSSEPHNLKLHLSGDEAEKSLNVSSISSSTKNKKKSVLESISDRATIVTDDDAPEEVLYESTKKKKKNRKSSENQNIDLQISEGEKETSILDLNNSVGKSKNQKNVSQIDTEENALDISVKNEKKKKKRLSETLIADNIETTVTTDLPLNISTSSSKKNKHKTVSQSDFQENEVTTSGNADAAEEAHYGSTKKSKRNKSSETHDLEIQTFGDTVSTNVENTSNSKKRKRKSSATEIHENVDEDKIPNKSDKLNESSSNGAHKKKRKIAQNEIDKDVPKQDADIPKKKSKKRKERDDDIGNAITKIFKENSFDKVHITRLPAAVINELDDQPRKDVLKAKKSSVVSTAPFIVEDARKRRNKPSKFLEESVYLNDAHVKIKQKPNIKKPKVLPFIPTASTSGSGFTTNFKINIIPQEVQFVAQTRNVANFKNEYLYGKKIKRLGTYETYKKHRNVKMSKF